MTLTSKAPSNPDSDAVTYLETNYDDVDGTAKLLDKNEVEVVISAIIAFCPGHEAQLKLITASEASSTVKRFIPSEYASVAVEECVTRFGQYCDQSATDIVCSRTADDIGKLAIFTANQLKQTQLKYTRVANGVFMDYCAQPHIASHLRPFKWGIDVATRRAVIPGTGEDIISMTYSKDVARFVVRLLDEAVWSEYSIISGSDTTLKGIIAIAEKVTGDTFSVKYDTEEDLKAGKATLVSSTDASYADTDPVAMAVAIGTSAVQGALALPKEGRLAFEDLHPMTIEQMITNAWSK